MPTPTATVPPVSREARARLERFERLVRTESEKQNLVSRSTFDRFAERHIDDALQLLPLVAGDVVLDIGSGAGLPGLAMACACDSVFHLVEPRRRRADFLTEAVRDLGLGDRVTVHAARIEMLTGVSPSTIVARAVAPTAELFAAAAHLIGPRTRWILPKGQSAADDLERARQAWQGEFALVRSATDPKAAIIVADHVRRRG